MVGEVLAVVTMREACTAELHVTPAAVANDQRRPGLTFEDAELAAICHPTLHVYGTTDSVGSVEIWKRVARVLPHGELSVVEGAGHMPFSTTHRGSPRTSVVSRPGSGEMAELQINPAARRAPPARRHQARPVRAIDDEANPGAMRPTGRAPTVSATRPEAMSSTLTDKPPLTPSSDDTQPVVNQRPLAVTIVQTDPRDHDPVGTGALARAAARFMRQTRLELLPAGHVPDLGHPQRVCEGLSTFIHSP